MPNSRIENCECLLFLLIILEMRSFLALECVAYVYFFKRLSIWEKIHSKFVKPCEMKNPPWAWVRQWNRVTHGETVGVESSEIATSTFSYGEVKSTSSFALAVGKKRKSILNELNVCLSNEKNKPFSHGCWASSLPS